MLESLQDWLNGIALLISGAILAWAKFLSSKISAHEVRLAVHESKLDDIPNGLRAIREELKGLREDGIRREERLYEQTERFRLELKRDLDSKVSK